MFHSSSVVFLMLGLCCFVGAVHCNATSSTFSTSIPAAALFSNFGSNASIAFPSLSFSNAWTSHTFYQMMGRQGGVVSDQRALTINSQGSIEDGFKQLPKGATMRKNQVSLFILNEVEDSVLWSSLMELSQGQKLGLDSTLFCNASSGVCRCEDDMSMEGMVSQWLCMGNPVIYIKLLDIEPQTFGCMMALTRTAGHSRPFADFFISWLL